MFCRYDLTLTHLLSYGTSNQLQGLRILGAHWLHIGFTLVHIGFTLVHAGCADWLRNDCSDWCSNGMLTWVSHAAYAGLKVGRLQQEQEAEQHAEQHRQQRAIRVR